MSLSPTERNRSIRGPRATAASLAVFVCVSLVAAVLYGCRTEVVELAPSGRSDEGEDAALPDDGLANPVGCAKADVLVVVDNSESMREEQANLARSFPELIDVVQGSLGTNDVHIMVVDTDASGLPSFGTLADLLAGTLSCEPAPSCCGDICVLASIPYVEAFVSSCNGQSCDEVFASGVDVCEGTLGAGRTSSATDESCDFVGPGRFMTQVEPDLAETFSCAVQVGTAGTGDEQPMAALVSALSPPHSASGGCNEGFLRDDAILIVVIVTEEDDSSSAGDPDQWKQSLLDVKGGDEQALVVLGLVADENVPGGLLGGPCSGSAEGAPRLQQFVEGFSFSSLGAVCASEYAPFFVDAAASIDAACRQFSPPR